MPLHEVALLDRSGDWPGALTAPGPPKGSRTSSEKPSNLEIRRDLCLLRPPQDFPLPHLRGTSRKVSISQAAAGGEGGGAAGYRQMAPSPCPRVHSRCASHTWRPQDVCNWDIKGFVNNFIFKLSGESLVLVFRPGWETNDTNKHCYCALLVPGTKTRVVRKKLVLSNPNCCPLPLAGWELLRGWEMPSPENPSPHPHHVAFWGRVMGATCHCP